TCPITLEWFNLKRKAFLSESSQIYLELALMQKDIERVYSIYNSFRKEKADATHLSEFHHIEYEGKVSQEENEMIALNLIKEIIKNLLKNNYKDFIYKRQGDKRINDYCIEILKKSKLDISKKIHEEIFTKYKEYLKLFNKNLQYCGYSIIIFQKRRFKDESELFLSREVSLNER
ncbi:MAG: amino acid--tRNA ligase-related protein, partial [Nanoarchaeota archaeon]|nr:amino acid--tRNA ligase-related protein [Nanoarchaeota archaeon]